MPDSYPDRRTKYIFAVIFLYGYIYFSISHRNMDTFTAIAEPNRRRMLDAMREQPNTVNMLVSIVGLSQPAVSKHLKCLREANLVTVRPEGQKRWYELNAKPLAEMDQFLEPYREFLSSRLDALELHLRNHSADKTEDQ